MRYEQTSVFTETPKNGAKCSTFKDTPYQNVHEWPFHHRIRTRKPILTKCFELWSEQPYLLIPQSYKKCSNCWDIGLIYLNVNKYSFQDFHYEPILTNFGSERNIKKINIRTAISTETPMFRNKCWTFRGHIQPKYASCHNDKICTHQPILSF